MKVYLREASEQDRDLLFKWVNDKSVRENSFSSKKILYDEHCAWFDSMMKDEDCMQWIMMADEEAVGQIRIDINGTRAEIDYSVCSERRGEGFGKMILKLARHYVYTDFPNVKTLVAKVKPTNIPSLSAFKDNGYKEVFKQLELEMNEVDKDI